jgi:hypothetical protein
MKQLLGIFVFFCSVSTVFAFQNEPDGFRGIKWGTDLSGSVGPGLESFKLLTTTPSTFRL